MDAKFLETLSGINKVLYKTSYEFEMKYSKNATHESAHQAGLDKIQSIKELREELEKPQTYVNVSTGERFTCTEAELMSKHA
jgi:hypothetical protein